MSELFDPVPKHGNPLRVSGSVPVKAAGRDVFMVISGVWRRRWIPMLGFVLGAAIGAWIFLLSGAQYKASAQILLSGRGHVQDVQSMVSDPVLAHVAGQLKLYQDNWFARPYWWQRVLPQSRVAVDGEHGVQARVLKRMHDLLALEAQESTGLWRLSGTYRNPDMAALIVNNVADAYRAHKLAEALNENNRLAVWLGARLEVLRGNVVQSRLALAELLKGQKLNDLSPDVRAQVTALEGDIASAQRLYEQSVLRYQEMVGLEQSDAVMARVVAHADIPSVSSPYVYARLILWLGFVGFGLGLVFSVLKVLWTQGFTSSEQLEAVSGYPVYSAVPMASKPDNVHHALQDNPAALLAESLRSLRVALKLRAESGRKPRTLVLTSTVPDEGKTSLAVMLASVAAKSGERVCVVDCDLRKPSLHKVFGIGNARGLNDYLGGQLTLDDVVYKRDPSGVHLVTAKAVPSYSLTLLTSGRMERLIANLREQYDLVILDAPSSLAFADARVLSQMVDQTLYVVGFGRTPRRAVLASLKNYADMGYDPLALVLNKVDMGVYLRDAAAAVIYRYGEAEGLTATPDV